MLTRLLLLFYFCCPILLNGQSDLVESNCHVSDTLRARVLLKEGDSLLKEQKFDLALEKAEEAKEIFVAVLGEETKEVADCLHLMGKVYYYEVNLNEAEKVWRTALDIKEKVLEKDFLDVANYNNALGAIYFCKSKYDEAICFYEKALSIRLFICGENHISVAGSYNNLGNIYYDQGKYKEAIKYHEKSLNIMLHILGENNLNVARSYNNLGNVYYSQGEYEKAIRYHEKSLNMRLFICGENHSDVADSYHNLGNVYYSQEYCEKAIGYYEESLKVRLFLYGKNHPFIAVSYNNLGSVYEKQKEYEKAIEYHRKSLDIGLSIYGKDHPIVADSYHGLGMVYSNQGEYKKAIEYNEKSLEVKLSIYSASHPSVAISYLNLGGVYSLQGKYEKSRNFYQKALACLNFKTKDKLDYVNSLSNLTIVLQNIGEVYYEQYQTTKNPSALSKSYYYLQQAIAANNYYSKKIGLDPKTQLAQTAFEVNDLAIATNLLLYQTIDSIHYLQEAFTYAENTKAIQLLEAMQEADAQTFSGIPDSLLEQEYDLRTSITFYEKQHQEKINNMFAEADSTLRVTKSDSIHTSIETDSTVLYISSKIFDLKRDYEKLKTLFEEDYPDYYRLKYDLSTISVVEVQQDLIDTTETLLEYFVGDSSIYIYVINKDDFHFHEIKKDFPLEEWVKIFRESNSDNNDNKKYEKMTGEYTEYAHKLYQKLIAPVAPQLKEKLIIVPDGILGYLPFEALLVEPVEKITRWKNHHYFLKDKQISYCYSATLLKEMKDKKFRKETPKGVLAIAPFCYDAQSTRISEEYLSYADAASRAGLDSLKHSGKEIYGIQKMVGADVFFHEAATKAMFTKRASNYKVLHIATHGKANDKIGDYSFLVFAEEKDSTGNMLLYVRDLFDLQLNAEMVVLSACETGIGELQKGEGIIGLTRGFTYAGTKSLITSLWRVNDESTKDLMLLFYKHLKDGMPKDAALRQAKLDYIANLDKMQRQGAHPYFWSGFIGIGDMSAIAF